MVKTASGYLERYEVGGVGGWESGSCGGRSVLIGVSGCESSASILPPSSKVAERPPFNQWFGTPPAEATGAPGTKAPAERGARV